MKKQPLILLVLFILTGLFAACASPSTVSLMSSEDLAAALKPNLRKSLQWNFTSLKKEFPVNIYYAEETTTTPREMILYIKNQAWERVGKEDDLSILRDYIDKKFIVMTLDLGNEPQ